MEHSLSFFDMMNKSGIIGYTVLFLGIAAFIMGMLSIIKGDETEYKMKVLPYIGVFIFMLGVFGYSNANITMHNIIATSGGQIKPAEFSYIQMQMHIHLFIGSMFGCMTYFLYMIGLKRTIKQKKKRGDIGNLKR